jgi:hypothetical protein
MFNHQDTKGTKKVEKNKREIIVGKRFLLFVVPNGLGVLAVQRGAL